MSEQATWYFVRHAEKERGDYHNARLGHQDEPLSAAGWAAAARLADYFAERPLAAIYVSGYQRTRQTAEAVAAVRDAKPAAQAASGFT